MSRSARPCSCRSWLTFPGGDGVPATTTSHPRAGAAYDLFGNGKTALKLTLGKYIDAASHHGLYSATNPAQSHRHEHDSIVDRRQSATSWRTAIS